MISFHITLHQVILNCNKLDKTALRNIQFQYIIYFYNHEIFVLTLTVHKRIVRSGSYSKLQTSFTDWSILPI